MIKDLQAAFEIAFGPCGRLLSLNKSKPDVIYNANIFVCDMKVWYGDFDKNKDITIIKIISLLLRKPIYVLREMDGRFEYESAPRIDKAVYKVELGRIV